MREVETLVPLLTKSFNILIDEYFPTTLTGLFSLQSWCDAIFYICVQECGKRTSKKTPRVEHAQVSTRGDLIGPVTDLKRLRISLLFPKITYFLNFYFFFINTFF